MLLDVFGVDLQDISTGEWILITLALISLPGIYWTAVVTHLIWRRPETHIVFRDEWAIDFRSHTAFGVVEVETEIAPRGSIMVAKAEAYLRTGWMRRSRLEPFFDQKELGLEGARRLGFMFKLDNKHLPLRDHDRIQVEIKLKDGATAKMDRAVGTAKQT
jgi:hypothetical protein